MLLYVFELFACVIVCFGQHQPLQTQNASVHSNLHNDFSESIGNFSVELLHAAAKSQNQNLIMSPFTAWTVLAVTAEGALGNTLTELKNALRISNNRTANRANFGDLTKWLFVNASTIELARFNGIFLDKTKRLETDFQQSSRTYYDTVTYPLDFKDAVGAANQINTAVSSITRGRIPKLVEESFFGETEMIITSGLYFRGQWTAPFNKSSTEKQAFYDSNGVKIGDVNMMYNRYTYPFANIKEIKARVIELPYGVENRLSMLVMLPNPGVQLHDMFLSLTKVPLDTVFSELRRSQEEYGDDEVDCFLPRFKIESTLEMTDYLKNLGIHDLFDQSKAILGRLAREPMYVSRVIHKAEIEVTEEGTTASGVTAAEFANRIGVIRFEANRPFSYLIIEKVTNTIAFGGVYQKPVLY